MIPAQTDAAKTGEVTILAVDDDPVALLMIEGLLVKLGYQTRTATNGQEALQILSEGGAISTILLDREMPGLSGVDVVRRLKADRLWARIPVIMVTGADDPDQIREGIDAGVFYYLQKPADARILSSVLMAALRQAEQSRLLQSGEASTRGFDLTEAAKVEFRTMEDAAAMAGFMANYFPDPDRAVEGLAALFFNAVEHGICAIGFEAKGQLLADGRLKDEIQQRLAARRDMRARATLARRADGVMVLVDDPGQGFNARDFLTVDLARSGAAHGRGILRAKTMHFDDLKYNDQGNRAVAFMRKQPAFEW